MGRCRCSCRFSFSLARRGGHLDTLHSVCQAVTHDEVSNSREQRRVSASLARRSRFSGATGSSAPRWKTLRLRRGFSRTALYLQFRNKEDIFRDLAGGLHEEGLSGAEAALAGDRPLADRLRAAVEAKTLRMIEIIQASPHGSELMDEKNRLCGDLATDSERRFQRDADAGLQARRRSTRDRPTSRQVDRGRGGRSVSHARHWAQRLRTSQWIATADAPRFTGRRVRFGARRLNAANGFDSPPPPL